MRPFIILSFMCLIIACSSSEETVANFLDCESHTEGYSEYDSEEIDCQFHYNLAEFEGKQFIELIAPCADLTRPYVINEKCIDICADNNGGLNAACQAYLNGRKTQDIILIKN